MAAANDATVVTCTNNSDYAVICSFFEQFGDKSGLLFPSFQDLQEMLENVEEVPYPLIELHVKLMRKLKKSVSFDRWEKAAAKYAHSYSDQDGWAIERFGYKKLNLDVKLRLLKNLLEAQFDGNIKFKNEINKVTSEELRLQPLGKDIHGRRYWHLLDDDCNLRVYREDLDEETWDLVSSDKESMLKLIEHLNSCKDLQEDGGTSPATSEENSANGQEEYPKIDTEDQVQQPVECPTGAKRLKSESVEVPATSDSHMECIVGETIESPVLVIKGEGNGADCDTGNPGEGKNEESCESHCSNSEQGKLGNTSVVACESDELNPCTEPGDPLAILQPKAESFSSVSSSVCNSNTSTSGSDNVTKAHHSQLENETSVEAKSVTKLTVPENSSENPSALNSHDKEISGSSCKQTGSAIVHPPSSSADSCKEMIHVESSLTTVLHEDEPVSIEKPSVEANVFPNQEGYLKPSEDNGIAKESNDDENRPLIVDTTDRCAVPEQTSTFENSTQLPFSQNQELPKFGCSSPIVGLNPIQLKFATAEESAPISDGPISSDHCSPSTSEIVTPNLMPSTECIPSAIEEEKQIAEPLSVPACSTLVQKDSSEIEESHSEQIVELKNEPLENSNSNVIINANTTEAESQLPIQTTHESPAQSGINHEIVIPVVDCSTPCDENSIWKVDETSKSSDVPNVLKESNIEESGPLDFGVASAIQSAKSFLPGAVPVSERAANVAVVDCTKDSDPPSAPCSLQETPQCSESDPISGSTIPLTLKEENNYSSPGNESEGTNEVHSSRSDVPLTQTNDLTSVLPAVGTTSAPVPDVEKSSETRTCPDTVNQSDSDECVVNVVRTSPEPTSNEVDTVSVSKLSEFRCVSPEDLQDAEKLNSSTVQELTNEKEIQCTMEDKLHPVDNEPSTNRIENIADKEEPAETECLSSSEEQGGTDTTILKDEQSLRDLQKGNEITNTMDILDKKVSADESEAIEKIPNTSTEKSLFSTEKGDEFFVSQKNVLNEVRLEKALEKEEIESVRLTSRKDEITPVQHHCESDATSQEIILNQDDALKAEENNQATTLAEVPTGPDIAIVPDSSREMESSTISEDIKPEQVDESKAEENPMATTLAVIPSGSEVAEEPESNLKLESNEISQDLVSKQPDKPKAAEDSVATPPAKIPSEQEVADETDADPEHESNAISQNIEYKQADKPKAEEDSVATAPAEIPSAQEVADETNPDPEHESNAISQNIEPKQGDESKAEENSVVPALAEVPSEPEVAENPEPNPEQESDTISQDIQPKQADESKAEEDSIETAQAKIPSGSEVAEKSDPNQELESNAISQNREPTQADECKAEEDSTATALAVLPSRLEVAEEPDPNLELESNAISQDIEPKLTISQNSEPQQNYESKTEDDSAATALATVPTVPEVAEEPDTNQESNGISKDIETKRANKPKAEEEQVATALAKLPPKPNVRLDDPPKIESIIVETAKVLKEETEKDADISTPPEKQEAILLKFPKEVPHLMVSEIKEKSELMQGFDGNCKVSIDPVQKELKEEILVAVIKQESPSVHEEPESNSIPMIPPKSEQWQTESGKVLTYKVPENEEVSVPTVKDVQSDVRNEVLSGATSEAATEKEPSGEDTKICVSESEQSEEKVKISSFKQELVIPKGQLNTELQSDGDTMMSSQLEIPVLLVKEESPPMVPDKSISDDIRDGCGSKIPIAVPEKNQGEERSVADELETIPRSASSDGKEPVQKTPALSIPEKEEKEAVAISEVVKSEESDTLPKVPNSSETPQNVEEKTTDQPSTEKSSNLNQLTFDFDSSAPVAIILPPSKKPDTSTKRRGRKRGRCGLDGNTDSGKENDAQPMVLRQSSRIAKLREKEDEDRRKEEAARLQRLKEEHERREKRRSARDEKMKKMEEKQQRRQLKTTTREDVTYRQSEEESSSSDEEKNSEEEGRKKKSKKDKRKHKKKKIDRPWDSTDSSEKSSESDVDGLDDLQVEEENEELVFKSDHEFSPESDLDDEEETVQPTKHARTARAGIVPKKRGRSKKVKVEEEIEEEEAVATEEEEEEEEAKCHKCGQSDHPEWILLCDRCDGGWHANCVKPPLLVIPEGHWFCPPCDHATLLERLQERLEAYEFLLQEKEAELERKKEQELEAKLAKEEADKQALLEAEEEAQEDDEEDEKISEAGDLGADGEDEETSEDSGEDEDEEDEDDAENDESDENLNGRRQRKAAKQANYSFKDFDDMIKSALRDEGDEEEEESGGKGKGKGPRSGVEGNSEDDEDKPRSPPGSRPSGIGNKRISTSDDDSDIRPQVIRKKKARKLNDLSATSNEDDSDEDFQGSSAEGSDSDDDDEEASDSGDSFVVDDDSDDDDVIHVRAKKKARVASPTIRRSARSSRKRNLRMDSSDTSEEESEYEEKPTKRKKGNESWDSSGASSSDASWGRSKKRSATKSRAKPVAAPKPKPKPPPRKAPANRGRGRGGRTNKVESDDEPFRSNVSVKKLKEAQPVKAQEEEDSDHAQKRTTRGRQISYKELISSGDSQDEDGNTAKKMGTLFAADRIRNMPGAAIRGGASRRGGRGGVITQAPSRVNVSGDDSTPVPVSVISSRIGAALNQDDESRFSGSTDTIEFSSAVASATAAASAYTTGDESHTSTDIVTPSIDPDLSTLPLVLPQEDEASPLIKEELPAIVPVPVLSQDLQISRLIQQRPVDVPPTLPPDLQINRLINSHTISSSSSSPARQSPGILPQQRLLRDVLDSQTPPPAVQLSPILPTQPPIIAPSVEPPLYSHSGVIKQTRHSLPPTPPLYSSPHVVKTSDLIASSTPPSVIRPYPTTATASPLSPSISGSSTPGNPLSIQGLLGTGHGSPGSNPSAPPSSHPSGHLRPYGNTPHMIGHGPFLNHTPYANPYSTAPPSRTSYMGTPVTPTPRQAYPPMYSSPHLPPHGLPLHSPYQHHGPPLRPTSSYQHAGFPQAFAAAAAAAASAEEERRIYRVAAQTSRESGADNYEPAASAGLLLKGGAEDPAPATAVPPESEFGGLVSYFSSQQEDFEES